MTTAARNRAAAVVVRGDHILMVEIHDDTRQYWTLPGGGIESDETPAQAAVRELAEETNLLGTVVSELLRANAPTPHWFFHVSVDDHADATVGIDPELPLDQQEIVGVAWRPMVDLGDDRQIALITRTLGPRWWQGLAPTVVPPADSAPRSPRRMLA